MTTVNRFRDQPVQFLSESGRWPEEDLMIAVVRVLLRLHPAGKRLVHAEVDSSQSDVKHQQDHGCDQKQGPELGWANGSAVVVGENLSGIWIEAGKTPDYRVVLVQSDSKISTNRRVVDRIYEN